MVRFPRISAKNSCSFVLHFGLEGVFMRIKNSGDKNYFISIRLTKLENEYLEELAKSVNVSKSEMIRILLKSQMYRSKEHENTLRNKYD